MKEIYFTPETIDARAKEFLDSLPPKHTKPGGINQSAALLVLDMQRYFLDKDSHAFIPSAEAVIPNIKRLQQAFLDRGLKVYQTRHINTPANALQMKTWWQNLLTEDNPYAAFIDDLCDGRAESFSKSQYDAFFATGLEKRLRRQGIKQVVITGVMTNLCCETTARSAFVRGFEVFFALDATATYNRRFHEASLLNLAHGFAVPLLTRDAVAQVRV